MFSKRFHCGEDHIVIKMHLESLKAFMLENKDKSSFFIFTNVANYYEDKIILNRELTNLFISKKPYTNRKLVTITNKLNTTNLPDDTVFICCNPVRDVTKQARNSRIDSNPYIYFDEEAYTIKSDDIAAIPSVKQMKLVANQIAEFMKVNKMHKYSIDASLSPDEFLIARDILVELLATPLNIKWSIVGSQSALNITKSRQIENFERFNEITWDLVIPNKKATYVTLLSDDHTINETLLAPFGLNRFESGSSGIHLYKPTMIV
jgi:hypothetical protein